MLSRLIDVSGWTAEQWLAATILVFVIVTLIVVAHRVIKVFKIAAQSTYQPNLRPLRRAKRVENLTENHENTSPSISLLTQFICEKQLRYCNST